MVLVFLNAPLFLFRISDLQRLAEAVSFSPFLNVLQITGCPCATDHLCRNNAKELLPGVSVDVAADGLTSAYIGRGLSIYFQVELAREMRVLLDFVSSEMAVVVFDMR